MIIVPKINVIASSQNKMPDTAPSDKIDRIRAITRHDSPMVLEGMRFDWIHFSSTKSWLSTVFCEVL